MLGFVNLEVWIKETLRGYQLPFIYILKNV